MAKENRPQILVIAPVAHIDGLMDKLNRIGDAIYMPDPTKEEVLRKMKGMNAIFTNPNKSKVYLGHEIISSSENLKVICTASTGRIHIDLQEAENSNVKVLSLTKELKPIEEELKSRENDNDKI